MKYELRLTTTASGSGFFSCFPLDDPEFEESLSYLHSHPNDEFMHKHVLTAIRSFSKENLREMIEKSKKNDGVLAALLFEACLVYDKFSGLIKHFNQYDKKAILSYTPLIYIKSQQQNDQSLHYKWNRLFEANILAHYPLPPPGKAGLKLLFSKKILSNSQPGNVNINELHKIIPIKPLAADATLPSVEETARHAVEKLGKIGLLAEIEMRHQSSLSPYALLRKWHLKLSVKNGRHDFSLSGIQTSYGKGLSLWAARASYAMEIVERCSSFTSVGEAGPLGYVKDYPLIFAGFDKLVKKGMAVLNPNDLNLEAPYNNEPLYWLEGDRYNGNELEPLMVPAQSVFLFSNLDEISLFSGLGSTGFASGNNIEEAKINALFEMIERDAEATGLYDPSRCFKIETDDPQISTLLSDYHSKGIEVQFQDMTSHLGIPCYKCFVITQEGSVFKGTGAHLNGKRALLSAMAETPYPYPSGPPSGSGPRGLSIRKLENLPDYSLRSVFSDLKLLENLLAGNGYFPVYIDLTRKDLSIPVIRVLVPGMELMADFDRFSRVSPRLFNKYFNMF
jgi:ribosomal protein S12 methylthiotransferase accessory factor